MYAPIWEKINITSEESTQRMKVPGGWLVCRVNGNKIPQTLAMCFLVDPDHAWDINSEPKVDDSLKD